MGPDSKKEPVSTSYHLPMPGRVPSPDLSGAARSLGWTSQGSPDKGWVSNAMPGSQAAHPEGWQAGLREEGRCKGMPGLREEDAAAGSGMAGSGPARVGLGSQAHLL